MTSSPEAAQVAVDDIGSAEAFAEAVDSTIKYFNDGDIVTGTVVKVDRDEVLLDIGYKTEGVIPSKELSIKHDVDPFDVVSVGDVVEALVQTKEDKEGRLILSKKRAQYERAWGTIEKVKERLNPDLEVLGILGTMYDSRTIHSREVLERVVEAFGDEVFHTVIRRTIKFPETTVAGEPITSYATTSPGAAQYRMLAREVLLRCPGA